MSNLWSWMEFVASLGIVLGIAGYLGWRALHRSEEPARLVVQWIFSGVLLFALLKLVPLALSVPMAGIPMIAAVAVILGLIWAPSVAEVVAQPLVNLFTGGRLESEARPLYSAAEARRKSGKYDEAIAEMQKQLAQFPEDFPGQLFLAEVYAEDLHDLPAAQATIEQILSQPGHARMNIAHALNRLADWGFKLEHNPEAARVALERIGQLFPGTEEAYHATQRLAHLIPPEELARRQSTAAIRLQHHEENLGLREDFTGLKRPEEEPQAAAARLVQRLESCPQDNEAREKLAVLYAEHYQRLDLATDQLEQLIAQPGAPARQIVRWLNLLCDLHIRHGDDFAKARQALQRVIERFPSQAAAEIASKRLSYLNLEIKAKQKIQPIPLTTAEPNLGLTMGGPPKPGG